MKTLSLQLDLCPEIPNVYGTLDYQLFREMLIKMDEILLKGGLEHTLVSQALNQYVIDHGFNSQKFYNSKSSAFHYKHLRYVLRCNIARHLSGESYRKFSFRLADSTLYQWFTGISAFACRKAVSKSTLDRYEKCFNEASLAENIRGWLAGLSDEKQAATIGLTESIDLKHG